MPLAVRKGDTGSHGGEIITGSGNVFVEGKEAARKGDIYACPRHGPNQIVEGSSDTIINGRKAVRHGDKAACGASMISGATKTYINGE